MRLSSFLASLLIGLLCCSSLALADTTLILLDNSGSMSGSLGGSAKSGEARRVIRDTFIPSLTAGGQAALWTFGGDCSALQHRGGFSGDSAALTRELSALSSPSGSTPLAWSVSQALSELQRQPAPRHLIVVTDGKDTCGGDPCGEVTGNGAGRTEITVHAVGLGMNRKGSAFRVLECMAAEGAPGGTAEVVEPGSSPKKIQDWAGTLAQTIQDRQRGKLLVRVIDAQGRETDMDYSAVALDSGQKFSGRTTEPTPLPVGEYRIDGNLPDSPTVQITAGETETVRLEADLGFLAPYSNCGGNLGYTVINPSGERVASSTLEDSEGVSLPPGDYRVELSGYPDLPPLPVTIKKNQATNLNLGSFGYLTIDTRDAAGGGLHLPLQFFSDAGGEMVGTGETGTRLTVPAGMYNVRVRPTHRLAGQFSGGANIEVRECEETQAALEQDAAILVCGNGERVSVISDDTGRRYTGKAGELIGVPPGRYNVLPADSAPIANVRVERGVTRIRCN